MFTYYNFYGCVGPLWAYCYYVTVQGDLLSYNFLVVSLEFHMNF